MTADEYAKQRGELERGIAYAEAAYQSASFRASTGAAKPEEVDNARSHYEAMKKALTDLVAAFHGAQVAASANAKAERAAAYAKLEKAVDAFATKRGELLADIFTHAEALAKAINAHVNSTADMRRTFHAYKASNRAVNLDGIDITLVSGPSPFTIAAAVLSENDVHASLLSADRNFFRDRPVKDMESRFIENLRGNLRLIAPKEV